MAKEDKSKEVKTLDELQVEAVSKEDFEAIVNDNLNLFEANKVLVKKLEKLEKALNEQRSSAKSPSCDCVVLDGEERKVVLRETAKELLQAVRRNEVAEDATVLVLDVHGG